MICEVICWIVSPAPPPRNIAFGFLSRSELSQKNTSAGNMLNMSISTTKTKQIYLMNRNEL